MGCRAALAWRSPPRLSRCRLVLPAPGDEAMPPSPIQTRAMASYNFIQLEWDTPEGRDINNYRPRQGLERWLI